MTEFLERARSRPTPSAQDKDIRCRCCFFFLLERQLLSARFFGCYEEQMPDCESLSGVFLAALQ